MKKLIALFVFVGLLATFSIGCNDTTGKKDSGKTGSTGSTGATHTGDKK